MQQHGISLNTLQRENGMRISSPRGQFDSIEQPYAVDKSQLSIVLSQVLTEESPHPLFPNMLLDSVEIEEDVASIIRIRANYLGLLRGTTKARALSITTGDVIRQADGFIDQIGRVLYVGIFVRENYVADKEPDPAAYSDPYSAEQLGVKNTWDKNVEAINPADLDFVLESQDWEKIGGFYQVTRLYKPTDKFLNLA